MKNKAYHLNHFLLVFVLILSSCLSQSTVISIPANQSMSITGKGPGQDAAINPFSGKPNLAIVKNVGKNEFSIRIQKPNREIREEIPIAVGEIKQIALQKDEELYFDAVQLSRAKIRFEKR